MMRRLFRRCSKSVARNAGAADRQAVGVDRVAALRVRKLDVRQLGAEGRSACATAATPTPTPTATAATAATSDQQAGCEQHRQCARS
jgi:hypothetical protein